MGRILIVISLSLVAVIASIFLYFNQVSAPQNTQDMIMIDYPKVDSIIQSPIDVSGSARGSWFFEASAPVVIVDGDGNVLGAKYITANGEWMTTDFVPFTGSIDFMESKTAIGKVIFQKDNPSGLPEYDLSYEVPVRFR